MISEPWQRLMACITSTNIRLRSLGTTLKTLSLNPLLDHEVPQRSIFGPFAILCYLKINNRIEIHIFLDADGNTTAILVVSWTWLLTCSIYTSINQQSRVQFICFYNLLSCLPVCLFRWDLAINFKITSRWTRLLIISNINLMTAQKWVKYSFDLCRF